MTDMTCDACGGPMIQKSRPRLFAVGSVMAASIALAAVSPYLWPPATLFTLTGIYLMIWATLGRGRWCRKCKRFRVA